MKFLGKAIANKVDRNPLTISLLSINWNTSKGNQAPPLQKFEKPYRKMPKSKNFLTLVKN